MKDKNFLISHGVNVDKSLELFGDLEVYNDTLKDFIKELPNKLEKIQEFKETSDMANYSILVHSLKSDARYFGFDQLGEIAYQHELKGKSNDMYYIADHFSELIESAKKALRISREYLGQDSEESSSENKTSSMNKQAILVVDDSNIVRNFIQKTFNDNYEVIVATDGMEAISTIMENANNDRIVGMLLDLNMPNIDGFEVLEYFKKHNLFLKIPVSIITGEGSKDAIDRAFQYPIIDVLSKPFSERDVKRIIERTLIFRKVD